MKMIITCRTRFLTSSGHMPSLVKLDFDVHGDVTLAESAILKLLLGLTKLQVITLSKKCLTSSILLQLSKLSSSQHHPRQPEIRT